MSMDANNKIKNTLFLSSNNAIRTVGVALLMMCASVHADGLGGALNESDFLQGLPLVMSATRLPQTVVDTPASITILDRKLINASGFTEIGDLFRLVPGFQVGLSWRDHHTATTYHGQTDGLSRRMQVLVDGRTAFTSQFGLTDWDRLGITVQDIERIEVVRGPASASYGSNAFVGAINIVTRDPVQSAQIEWFATVGSEDTQITGSRYRHIGERLEYTASANYLHSDGFSNGNNDVAVVGVRLQGRYLLPGSQLLEFQLGHASGPSGRGGNGSLPDPLGHKKVAEQHSVLRFTEARSPDNEWYLQFSYDRTRRDDRNRIGTVSEVLTAGGIDAVDQQQYLDDFTTLTGIAFDNEFLGQQTMAGPYDYHADRLDLEFQQTLVFGDKARLAWGAGARKNRIKGHLVLKDDAYFEDLSSRVYGNWEYRMGDWLVNAGAMFEGGDMAAGDVSPRIGVNYRVTENHRLRASIARGWRHPFIGEANHEIALKSEDGFTLERFLEVPGDLSPERITTNELGYVGWWLDGKLSTEVKLYREQIRNEIQEHLVPCYADSSACELSSLFGAVNGNPNGVIYRVNGGSTDVRGVEGNLDLDMGGAGRLWLSYAYADADQQLPAGAVRSFYSHSGTPVHTASALWSLDFSTGWQISAGYYYRDRMAWFFFGGDTETYDRVDLRAAKDFTVEKSRFRVEWIAQNIVGSSYSEFTPVNQFGRRQFLRFSWQLD